MSLVHKSSKRPESFKDNDADFKSFLEPCHTPTSCKSAITPKRKHASCDFSKTTSTNFPKSSKNPLDILNKTQALAKQTEKIRQIVDKKKTNCKTLFKTHAIQLNKEGFLRIHKNDTCPIIQESICNELQNVKKLISNVLEMNEYTYLRSIRGLISEIYDKIGKINVEIEAKVATMAEKYEFKIKELEGKCEKLECRYSVQEKKVIDSLVEKNLQLSGRITELEEVLNTQKNKQKVKIEFDFLSSTKHSGIVFEDESRLVSTENSTAERNELNHTSRTPEQDLGLNCYILNKVN